MQMGMYRWTRVSRWMKSCVPWRNERRKSPRWKRSWGGRLSRSARLANRWIRAMEETTSMPRERKMMARMLWARSIWTRWSLSPRLSRWVSHFALD
jgi:hypothetical protein